jgi:hypothetical protein
LWLVLPLCNKTGGSGKQLQEILRQKLGSYDKNGYDVDRLLEEQGMAKAIERAKQIDTPPQDPWPHKSGTHVYRLVEKLIHESPPDQNGHARAARAPRR